MNANDAPTMNVARAYSLDDVRVEAMPLPNLEPGDVLVQVVVCGVCSSDAMDWYVSRKVPVVLGHEPVGIVHKVTPEVEELEVGDRYLLFLQHRSPEVIRTVGMSQGAYRVREDPDTKKEMVHPYMRGARLLHRFGPKDGQLGEVAPWLTRSRPLSEISEEIRAILEVAK